MRSRNSFQSVGFSRFHTFSENGFFRQADNAVATENITVGGGEGGGVTGHVDLGDDLHSAELCVGQKLLDLTLGVVTALG